MPDAAQLIPNLPKLATFPKQMREAARWLLWRDDKVPHYVNGRRRGSYGDGKLDGPGDIEHLVDAKTALAKLKASNGRYSGLGFALGGGWYGLDFDHVIDPRSRIIMPWVENVVTCGVMEGMYGELSPSATGLHLIGYTAEGCNFRNGKQCEHVEAYHSGRYFTVTGSAVFGAPTRRDVTVAPTMALNMLPALKALGAPMALRLVEADGVGTAQEGQGGAQGGKVGSGWLADRDQAVAALKWLSADCSHDEWLRVGLALHHASKGIPEGLALWEQWSATAAGRVNERGEPRYVPGHCATRWQSFSRSAAGGIPNPVTLGSLIHKAKEAAGEPEREADVPRETSPVKRKFPGDLPESFTLAELKRMAIPATRWLVDKLIAPGLTLLAAPPKAGKSYLALQMALCVAAGKPFLDRETNASPVCYFDLEEEHGLLLERVAPIQKAHGVSDAAPIKFRLTMPTGDEAVAALAAEIAQGYKLLIVDIFARMRDEVNEDAKKNAYARDYKVIATIADFAMQHTDVAIIIIHHANKGAHDEWQAKISGSYGLAGGSHANVYMARPDMRGSKNDDEKAEAARYRILHAVGKRVPEQEVVIEQMANMGGWQCSELRSGEISLTLKRREVIAFLQQRHPSYVAAKEVAAGMGVTLKSMQRMLYLMAVKGLIESEGQGGAGYRAKPPRA